MNWGLKDYLKKKENGLPLLTILLPGGAMLPPGPIIPPPSIIPPPIIPCNIQFLVEIMHILQWISKIYFSFQSVRQLSILIPIN